MKFLKIFKSLRFYNRKTDFLEKGKKIFVWQKFFEIWLNFISLKMVKKITDLSYFWIFDHIFFFFKLKKFWPKLGEAYWNSIFFLRNNILGGKYPPRKGLTEYDFRIVLSLSLMLEFIFHIELKKRGNIMWIFCSSW